MDDPTEYNNNMNLIIKGEEEDDMAQSVQTFETILKRKLEMTAEDLIRTASTLTKAASTLCQPSSNLSPSPSTSLPGEKGGISTCGKGLEVCTDKPKDGLPGEKGGILTCGEGLEVCTKKPDVPLVPAFYRAMTTPNLKPTCTDIKGYLAEGKTVDDELIQNLLLRVQEKGWQEVAAYHYEQVYSLPPGTGHQRFKVMDKERRCYSPESVSSGSMFPPAEKDVIPPEKRPKPYPTKGVVHRAYYKATYEQGIKYPTLSDIKRIMEDLWRSSTDPVGIHVGIPEHPIPDEEIESIRLNIKASGVYMK